MCKWTPHPRYQVTVCKQLMDSGWERKSDVRSCKSLSKNFCQSRTAKRNPKWNFFTQVLFIFSQNDTPNSLKKMTSSAGRAFPTTDPLRWHVPVSHQMEVSPDSKTCQTHGRAEPIQTNFIGCSSRGRQMSDSDFLLPA